MLPCHIPRRVSPLVRGRDGVLSSCRRTASAVVCGVERRGIVGRDSAAQVRVANRRSSIARGVVRGRGPWGRAADPRSAGSDWFVLPAGTESGSKADSGAWRRWRRRRETKPPRRLHRQTTTSLAWLSEMGRCWSGTAAQRPKLCGWLRRGVSDVSASPRGTGSVPRRGTEAIRECVVAHTLSCRSGIMVANGLLREL